MAMVQVDTATWVAPWAVEAVTPGTSAYVARIHLRNGTVLAVGVGGDHMCPDVTAVAQLLSPDRGYQVDSGWNPADGGYEPQPFPPGTITAGTPQ